MSARAVVIAGIVTLAALGLGETRAAALSATPVTELRVEWDTTARGGYTVVRGYVYNQRPMRAEHIRLVIEGLDQAARPVTTRVTYVMGTIPNGDRGYFEASVPTAASYRVSIESFDRAQCGNG